LFKKQGKVLHIVGGAVRDFLRNENPKDFDLATDATPEEVIKIIGNRWRISTQGKAFLVVVVYTEDQPNGMEIATFREDVYGDMIGKSRNPETKISTIEKDVCRRDIPYNALFFDIDKKSIIDIVGGIEDIKNKITRFVGDPDMRIKEDPLRILRILRFSARYNFKIEENTKMSIIKNKNLLEIITKERIWEEFVKSYKQTNFVLYLSYINEFNMWNNIFPGSTINENIQKCSSLELYIANLFKDEEIEEFSKTQNKLVQKYLIPIDVARVVVFLISLSSLSVENAFDMYKMKERCHVDNRTISEWCVINNLSDDIYKRFIKYKPSVSAENLIKQGFKGKSLGEQIKKLEIEKFKEI
jgi:tRNA nucleotidyltransferase/poly(A) polymerase